MPGARIASTRAVAAVERARHVAPKLADGVYSAGCAPASRLSPHVSTTYVVATYASSITRNSSTIRSPFSVTASFPST